MHTGVGRTKDVLWGKRTREGSGGRLARGRSNGDNVGFVCVLRVELFEFSAHEVDEDDGGGVLEPFGSFLEEVFADPWGGWREVVAEVEVVEDGDHRAV